MRECCWCDETGSHKSLATPSEIRHCPFPLPPALCHCKQTGSFYQLSLFSKHPALQGGPAVSGPHQTGTGAQLKENKSAGEGLVCSRFWVVLGDLEAGTSGGRALPWATGVPLNR